MVRLTNLTKQTDWHYTKSAEWWDGYWQGRRDGDMKNEITEAHVNKDAHKIMHKVAFRMLGWRLYLEILKRKLGLK